MTDLNARLYLVEIVAYTGAGTETLRYASGQGFVTGASESPASTYYEPRVKQPALLTRSIFREGATSGQTQISTGVVELLNPDGGLDALLNYGFDGRAITVRSGLPGAAYPSGFTSDTYTMEQAEFTQGLVTIRLRDRQFDMQRPLQATKYAGSNALPAGKEGVAGDLKGKPKPVCYGVVTNVEPPCVNTSKLTYQVNDGAVADIPVVYDAGVALTKGADYGTVALLQAAAPAAGTYATCFADGYFQLGASPSGQVTADVTEGTNAAARTTGQVFARLMARAGKSAGTTDGTYLAADVTALDALTTAVIGVWFDTETTFAEAFDQVCAGAGAWWGVDRSGVFRVQQLVLPSGTPAATFTDDDVIGLERVVTTEDGHGIPCYRVIVRYGRNYTVQTTGLAAGVTDARRAVLAEAWRETSDTDASVQTAHLLAPEMVVPTPLAVAADAATEATRLLTLRKTRRDRFVFRVVLDSTTALLDLGSVISLTYPRFGLDSGKLFRIIGVEPDAEARLVTFSVWGGV